MAEEFIIKLYTRPDPRDPTGSRDLIDSKTIQYQADLTQYVVTFESPQANLQPGTDYMVNAVAKSGDVYSEPVEEMVSTGKFWRKIAHFIHISCGLILYISYLPNGI